MFKERSIDFGERGVVSLEERGDGWDGEGGIPARGRGREVRLGRGRAAGGHAQREVMVLIRVLLAVKIVGEERRCDGTRVKVVGHGKAVAGPGEAKESRIELGEKVVGKGNR